MADNLTAGEREAIKGIQRSLFLTAATIVSRVTQGDVEAAQAGAFARGATVSQVASIDRAAVAETLLRLAADGKGPYAL